MARQRFIWPDLWHDPELGRVSERALLLYIGCFSNADDEGRLLGDPLHLKATIYPYRSTSPAQIKAARDELEAACSAFLVYEHRENEYIALLNWSSWQRPKYPRPSRLPAPPRAAQRQYESQKPSGNRSSKRGGTAPPILPQPSGSGSSAGRDGMGSTPLNPPRRRTRRSRNGSIGDAPTKVGARQAFAAFIAGAGWDETYDEELIREELERVHESPLVDDTLEIDEALELWRTERARRYPSEVVS